MVIIRDVTWCFAGSMIWCFDWLRKLPCFKRRPTLTRDLSKTGLSCNNLLWLGNTLETCRYFNSDAKFLVRWWYGSLVIVMQLTLIFYNFGFWISTFWQSSTSNKSSEGSITFPRECWCYFSWLVGIYLVVFHLILFFLLDIVKL